MSSDAMIEKMESRKNYRNLWHTDLMHTMQADPAYCCLSLWCAPCVSYLLRKRALYDDMNRYVCCAGYMPCSGRCGERKCPEFCLCTETQHKVEMDKRDGKFGPQPMAVPPVQAMSRLDQPIPPAVGYPPQQPYGGAYGYPPQQPPYPQGYPPAGYPPPVYDQPAYPPAAYPPPGSRPPHHY